MRHLSLEIERLEERIAPGGFTPSCGARQSKSHQSKSNDSKSHQSNQQQSKNQGSNSNQCQSTCKSQHHKGKY